MLLAAAILGVVLLFGIIVIDAHLIPMRIVGSALVEADLDPEVWRNNLTTGLNHVSGEFQSWYAARGGTFEESRKVLHFLWTVFPIAVFVSFLGLLLCLRLTSKSYNIALNELVLQAVDRDLKRIRNRYALDNAAFKPGHRRHPDHRRPATTECRDSQT